MNGFWSANVLWVLVGVFFLAAELAWPGFVLFFFAIGAFASAVLATLAPVGLGWQLVCFLVVSGVGLALLRRMFLRVFRGERRSAGAAAGTLRDVAVGRTALVSRAIAPGAPGEIKFRGSFWRAVADEAIERGEHVIILGSAANDADAYRVRRSGAAAGPADRSEEEK